MGLADDQTTILVTGACGHLGREVCRVLSQAGLTVLPTDLDVEGQGVVACDLRSKEAISRLFQRGPIRAVIHLAGILPSAFEANPALGTDVNVGGSVELMRQSAAANIERFLFASSMSVYGKSPTPRPVAEGDPAAPDDCYGAAKRVVELIGERLAKIRSLQFVALRIARVVGPGIKKTSSPWRSQIFEANSNLNSISVPFSPRAMLSLVHASEVAKMFLTLVRAAEIKHVFYNTPVEIWQAKQLQKVVEDFRALRIELGPEAAHGGPLCDGGRFSREFGFHLRGLREYLEPSPSLSVSTRQNKQALCLQAKLERRLKQKS